MRESIALTNYTKLFRTVADRYNGILVSLFLLVAETINSDKLQMCLADVNETLIIMYQVVESQLYLKVMLK